MAISPSTQGHLCEPLARTTIRRHAQQCFSKLQLQHNGNQKRCRTRTEWLHMNTAIQNDADI